MTEKGLSEAPFDGPSGDTEVAAARAASQEPWTAREVVGALYRHYRQRMPVLTEITATEPEPTGGYPFPRDRRCDVLVLGKGDRIMVEVKVSRADFLSDVRAPEKQALWSSVTHRRAYAVPLGLVTSEEVPDGWGLLTVERRSGALPHEVRWARRAPKRPGHTPLPLPERAVYALMHRLARLEADAKGHGWGVNVEDAAALRSKIERLTRDLDVERNRRMRAEDRARMWHRRFSACEPPACETCARPLAPDNSRKAYGAWRHTDADELVCEPLRRAAEQARVGALDDERRSWQSGRYLHVPGPSPVLSDVLTTGEGSAQVVA